MAFCSQCGRQLKEGEICECQKMRAENVAAANAAANAAAVNAAGAADGNAGQPQTADFSKAASQVLNSDYANKVKSEAKGAGTNLLSILKAPVTNGVAFVKETDFKQAIYFVVCQAILSCIFALEMIGKVNKLIGIGGSYLDDYKFSYIGGFFLTFLFSVIFSALFAVLVLAGAKLAKCELDWMGALKIAGIRSIITSVMIVAGIIFALINVGFGIAIYYLAILPAACFVVPVLLEYAGEKRDRMVYISFIVFLIFIAVTVFIMSKAAVLYLPSSIRDGLDSGIEGLMDALRYF